MYLKNKSFGPHYERRKGDIRPISQNWWNILILYVYFEKNVNKKVELKVVTAVSLLTLCSFVSFLP